MSDKKSGVIVYACSVDKKSTMHGQQTAADIRGFWAIFGEVPIAKC